MIRIIINGCNGKMGQVVASMAAADPDFSVVAGIDKFPSVQKNPFPVYSNINECMDHADVLIDFSRPEALLDVLEYAQNGKMGVVIATTGHTPEDHEYIKHFSKHIPIFISANMSLGVNLMIELIQKAASFLGDSYDVEIIEKHHNQKVDSPSGTALALASAINETFLNAKHYVYGRHSKYEKRSTNEIGIHAIRGGTIVGEHQVLFIGQDETIEINHIAQSKQIFAVGALRAAKHLVHRIPGLYNMKDILMEQSTVTSLYTDSKVAMITIHHVPHQPKTIAVIFDAIAKGNINIDMISQTSPLHNALDISFTLPQSALTQTEKILNELKRQFPQMETSIFTNITKLSVEGIGMERQSGVAAKIFHILADQDIKVKIVTTSEIKISYVIDQADEKKAIETIIQAFQL